MGEFRKQHLTRTRPGMLPSPLVASSMGPGEVAPPRLPVRASIYVAPDGRVHFGALFAELLPVAAALSTPTSSPTATATSTSTPTAARTATPTSTSTR